MEIEQKLLDFVASELQHPRETLSGETRLIETGVVDSLGLLQIVEYVESEFGVEIQDEELVAEHFGTVDALAGLVRAKLNGEEA